MSALRIGDGVEFPESMRADAAAEQDAVEVV